MVTDGRVYSTLLKEAVAEGRPYAADSLAAISSTVTKLDTLPTSCHRPAMLLGMIQSGKTRTFLGVIALAADNGFDLFIVLTKGTKALTTQTFERLQRAYDTVIEMDGLRVFDIMDLPKLTRREKGLPLIIVAKKETRNLERLRKAVVETYPELSQRRTLFVDDEADFASVGFKKSKDEAAELRKIMKQIDGLRTAIPRSSFLQVTATPYSLYLQPSKADPAHGPEFKPVRPAFTELVPVHGAYVGGKTYFEDAAEPGTAASRLYVPVDPSELDILHHEDKRRLKLADVLTNDGIATLRQAVMSFVVGGVIRRLQAKRNGERPEKYSFIMHTEAARSAHAWQERVIDTLVEKISDAAEAGDPQFDRLVEAAYADVSESVGYCGGWLPTLDQVVHEVRADVGCIQVEKVNTDNDVAKLLDRDGQLKLRNRFNIFIGGQILDRGLTIANLIGFYYGRRANRVQQDTVLQHARMYGARPAADMAVTRFYTSPDMYRVLRIIHEFDAGLREAFRVAGNDAGVAFIRKEGTRIIPCSPNKILVSAITTLKAGKRLLPVGFQAGFKTHISRTVKLIDDLVQSRLAGGNAEAPALIDLTDANRIVDLVAETFEEAADSAYEWDVEAFKASMEYVSRLSLNPDERGRVYLLVRHDRDNVRVRPGGRFFDAPDTSHVEGRIAREVAQTLPMLMLFRQHGLKERGWQGTPFWWPVLYMPQQMGTVVFASDVNDYDEDLLN